MEDKQEITKALQKYAAKYRLPDAFVDVFGKEPPYAKDYGAYSAKAIRKLLPLMRMGRFWSADAIDVTTINRIDKILSGEWDSKIDNRVREKTSRLRALEDFSGLPLWLACYVVYNRHSEAKDTVKWSRPEDIDGYLAAFKQHSLRNPVVEQVLTETLRTVRDIWKQVGHIDEIHVELGRDMKNTAKKRAEMSKRALDNENANLRIKYLLAEFMNSEYGIENVRPNSPSQQETLRIYEDGVLNGVASIEDDIQAILKKFNEREPSKRPSHAEVMRYKLWLEQKYRSPYTGRMIPLAKLFTHAYEIEHVIPQSRYFDDSLSNKVICESAVNKLKDRQLGHEFILNHHGQAVPLGMGEEARVLSVEEYEQFVKSHYARNRAKMRKLLMDDIPDDFISSQLNDSRYISKLVKALLSNIVREDGEQEAISKNVIPCTGGITDRLKRDWGVTDVWNKIILPRFRRLNTLVGNNLFTVVTANNHEIPSMPLELQRGFNKKRIDHRHHAMDAVVIACAGRNIVNYLNNESAMAGAELKRMDLQRLLCEKERLDSAGGYKWLVAKPWPEFTQDLESLLRGIIVSFKANRRILTKTDNRIWKYTGDDKKKRQVLQRNDSSWAVRKPLHKDTVFGEVNLRLTKEVKLKEALQKPMAVVDKELKAKLRELLGQGLGQKEIVAYFKDNKDAWREVNLDKIRVYYFTQETNKRYFATRKPLDASFSPKDLEHVTDTGIYKILSRHLEECGGDYAVAFSPEGVERMNKDIQRLNDGKKHQPILKVRLYEQANKFAVGQVGNKSAKFVEAAQGTNLFFAVYEQEVFDDKKGETYRKRHYATIPLRIAVERRKKGLPVAMEDENGNRPIFVLSPTDLVYLPTQDELEHGIDMDAIDKDRIYKAVSFDGPSCFFISHHVAKVIVSKQEYSLKDKMERAITGEMIKETCVPVTVDRLGNIVSIGYRK